jgi:RecG-like helicase
LQLAHPDFVLVNEHGEVIGGTKRNAALASTSNVPLVGLYPLTAKLRTWTIAECAALALESVAGIEDPVPEWIRQAAGVIDLESAFRAVHQPIDKSADQPGSAAVAVRRGVRAAADYGVPASRCGITSSGASQTTVWRAARRVRPTLALQPY